MQTLAHFIMFSVSFLLHFFVVSGIMTNSLANITFSLGKAYMATIMGLFMVMLDIAMRGTHLRRLIPFGGLSLLFIIFYRTQFGVCDTNFLREMKEHHSMAVLTSQQILKKTERKDVALLAQHLMVTQESEINEIEHLLDV